EVPGDREQLGLVGLGALDDVVQDGAAGGVVGQQAEEEAPGEGLRLEVRAGDRPREPGEERGAASIGRGVGLLGSTVLDALGEAHLAAFEESLERSAQAPEARAVEEPDATLEVLVERVDG